MEETQHDPHLAAAPDVNSKANLVIWGYFIALAVLLYITIAGLKIYFQYELESEQYSKIGSRTAAALTELRQTEHQVLSGERGVGDAKTWISIEAAMEKYLQKQL